jgi:hypothetical protein
MRLNGVLHVFHGKVLNIEGELYLAFYTKWDYFSIAQMLQRIL